MSDQIYATDVTREAAEDLDSYQFCVVGLDSSNKALLSDGGVDVIIDFGILQNKPKSGEGAQIRRCTGQESDVRYGGTVAVGDYLKSNGSNGRMIATTTEGNRYLGIATIAGVTGDIGGISLEPGIYASA